MLRWLCNLAGIELIGTEPPGNPGAILLVRDSHAAIFHAIYTHHLSKRRGLFIPSRQDDENSHDDVTYLKNRYDALIAIPTDDGNGSTNAGEALRLARAADALIFPIGIGITPQIMLPGKSRTVLPLPGARVAVVIEAPFKTAEHPEQIPTSWHTAMLDLLERANAQARQHLSSAQ